MPWSNQPGGPWGSGSRGPWGSGPQSQGPKQPDLEEFLRRSQDRLRGLLPGNLGGRGIAVIALISVALWGLSGFFKVEPDEIGVVLRFGKFVREVPPGLNYHLPYPIETALTPPALRVNKIDIGFDMRGGATMRDVPEESLMLTGDENIVDVDFSVLWQIKPNAVGDYLFNVAESRRHREGGGRKRHARGDRPIQHPADPHRRAAKHRDGGAGADAEDARQLRRRHPGTAGAVAEGRSAGPGHRRLPRRAGGALGSRAPAKRGADLRQSRGAGSQAAAPPRSSRTPKPIASRPSPRPRARPRASCKSTSNTRRRPT